MFVPPDCWPLRLASNAPTSFSPHGSVRSSELITTAKPTLLNRRRAVSQPPTPSLPNLGISEMLATMRATAACAVVLFVASAAADDDGDNFSNNLFSDLAP